ncbi:MAG: helix-turn-helix domain-containing protein [Desulfitobacteriaceae bacterium]
MNKCHFGRYLKKWRLRRGITLRELEKKIGLKRHYLLKIERGLHKGTPNLWIRLIKELNVSLEQFTSDCIESSGGEIT